MAKPFNRYSEFYLYYLSEHQDPRCRALHYIGSFLVLGELAWLTVSGLWGYWWILPLTGYGFAWLGHFRFEHNKPATFKYPVYSLISDWVMLKDWLTGQLPAKLERAASLSSAGQQG
ncbi:DUF962 domain-containing protein [Ferrimonas marina]|uniref:DUF962 domain-containing protein n=1 Tax=Ferrimonas marina TaxID=299255 RepID=A0A1M5R8R8_9GAMM|nr:DUF962 domain-containing protein [Ferrimonas marina]SHH22490.1 hypothetical protein SAMN02745129_1522 [Ferrimonas marina]